MRVFERESAPSKDLHSLARVGVDEIENGRAHAIATGAVPTSKYNIESNDLVDKYRDCKGSLHEGNPIESPERKVREKKKKAEEGMT